MFFQNLDCLQLLFSFELVNAILHNLWRKVALHFHNLTLFRNQLFLQKSYAICSAVQLTQNIRNIDPHRQDGHCFFLAFSVKRWNFKVELSNLGQLHRPPRAWTVGIRLAMSFHAGEMEAVLTGQRACIFLHWLEANQTDRSLEEEGSLDSFQLLVHSACNLSFALPPRLVHLDCYKSKS
jgi:hypothetical protein